VTKDTLPQAKITARMEACRKVAWAARRLTAAAKAVVQKQASYRSGEPLRHPKAKAKSKIEINIKSKIEINIKSKIEIKIKGKIEINIKGKIEINIKSKIEIKIKGKIEIKIKGKIEINIKGKIEINIKGKIPGWTLPWNPTLAHKTRKDGAPATLRPPVQIRLLKADLEDCASCSY